MNSLNKFNGLSCYFGLLRSLRCGFQESSLSRCCFDETVAGLSQEGRAWLRQNGMSCPRLEAVLWKSKMQVECRRKEEEGGKARRKERRTVENEEETLPWVSTQSFPGTCDCTASLKSVTAQSVWNFTFFQGGL